MNAIDLLKSQHREVEDLFGKLAHARQREKKEHLFTRLADVLAIHASIEEHHFYPGVRAKPTEELLYESLEEHLGVKRVLSDLLDTDVEDETFEAKLTVLKDLVVHHVEKEERLLFPKVGKSVSAADLAAIAEAMAAEQAELEEKGRPREAVPAETEKAAPL